MDISNTNCQVTGTQAGTLNLYLNIGIDIEIAKILENIDLEDKAKLLIELLEHIKK